MNDMDKPLLAKRVHSGGSIPPYARLPGHAADVADACGTMCGVLGHHALHRFGVNRRKEELCVLLRLFGWLHDCGKAGDHFRNMIDRLSMHQLIRHEVVSALLLRFHPGFAPLTEQLGELKNVLFCLILGHHRKFPQRKGQLAPSPLTVPIGHPDFQALIEAIRRDIGITDLMIEGKPIVLSPSAEDSDGNTWSVHAAVSLLRNELINWAIGNLPGDMVRLIALGKGLAIAGDVLGSAFPGEGGAGERNRLIRNAAEIGLDPEDLDQVILHWAKARGIANFVPREFQKETAESSELLTLVEAGCGSGKSIAAYMWARSWALRCREKNLPPPRLFFCLPTMGTATEQYKDYVMDAVLEALLEHSRADIDLETIRNALETEDDESEQESIQRAEDTIDAFRIWQSPFVVCTADTVLGLMVNARKSLYHFPAMVNGIFVFDEIHAMDKQMFRHLLMFLRHMPNAPVLLMTASLSEHRKSLLAAVRGDGELKVISRTASASIPRYLLHRMADKRKVESVIEQIILDGGKVLVVCNTVRSACNYYEQLKKRFEPDGVRVELYHAQYRYRDRSVIHRRVIDEFKQASGPVILVATQVAEMSLDLSADLLITELASIAAMIQRLGRLNRTEFPKTPKPAWILMPEHASPYEPSEIEQSERWLDNLIALGRALSQEDLANMFGQIEDEAKTDIAEEMRSAYRNAVFVSGVWKTEVGMIRDHGYTINVILERDLADYREKHGTDPDLKWVKANEVPITLRSEVTRWRQRIHGRLVAPCTSIHYDFDPVAERGKGAEWVS